MPSSVAVQPASISHARAKSKETTMLIALLSLAVLASAARGAWLLVRLWRALPRHNRDFGLV
jgi:hypothetical protein